MGAKNRKNLQNGRIPAAQGLYDPRFEHDSCGVNFVCNLRGEASHEIVQMGIDALCTLQHRGAIGAEKNTGDGAGILMQIPDKLYRDSLPFDLPAKNQYATGIAFLPHDVKQAERALKQLEKLAEEEDLVIIGWRELPIEPSDIGMSAKEAMPYMKQIFVKAKGDYDISGLDLDRKVFPFRKRAEREIYEEHEDSEVLTGVGTSTNEQIGVYFPSLSSRTIVYKGMLTTLQLGNFFLDLHDERTESAMVLVHSRFSTNTFPSWPLAHPYRFIAHNGEINTVQGNRNWMKSRETLLETNLISGELDRLFPICTPGASDTASFDEVLELLVMGGYSLPEAILMMIPEPWENHENMTSKRRAFYQYHSTLMEPWDGPASIAFTDGTLIGAVLDRNGLRPSRYWVTSDDLVVMASEVGVLEIEPENIIEKGRLEPGRMFLIDTEKGRIVRDSEIKENLESEKPYSQWLEKNFVHLRELPEVPIEHEDSLSLQEKQQVFGYTHEEIKLLLAPMVRDEKEAIGSMGNDAPIAALSQRPRKLYDYFQQLFAQVTNPPLDGIREELITAVCVNIGSDRNLLSPEERSCTKLFLPSPVLTEAELSKIEIATGSEEFNDFKAVRMDAIFEVEKNEEGLRAGLDNLRKLASKAVADGANILIISDRLVSRKMAPIPSLLAVGAVHHHLISEKSRSSTGIIVESGDAREVHHIATLIGYGASAVCPYTAYETIDYLIDKGKHGLSSESDPNDARRSYIKAVEKGMLKIMSKMGISTVASYSGAQIFEAIGLGHEIISECFTGTVSRLGGVGFEVIANEVKQNHQVAFPSNPGANPYRTLEPGGEYQWRRDGEFHLFNPETVFKLQHATKERRYDIFREYTKMVDSQSEELATLRGLFKFDESRKKSISVDEVEPVSEIVKRFATGAMSYGSISGEAHETLAIAMNRIGGKSNTGEGGEDAERFVQDENGDLRRSAIKQVASGRFGVTSEYLVNSDDIQIKMAQGAKPGEGGQLPGHKVYPWIAKTRHSTPGVGLISPPPHHDIYSIEDLAQLIYDLKNANPEARVHVKLVAEVGVGTVAAGVSKGHADVVLISGHDGGTGASPLTSIKHAGAPWELGLAETQQTLLLNGLRDRIVVQVDGQLKTGRDVVIAALLGADEFGFATAPLVVMGCIMMRACHLDTCPVGVATQNPELRKKFTGKPEFVVNFFEFIAEEVREILAELGFRSLEEAIGQVELLDTESAISHWKADGLDLSPILYAPPLPEGTERNQTTFQDHGLEAVLDRELIEKSKESLDGNGSTVIDCLINNTDRSVGTLLGYELTKRHGGKGLPDETISVNMTGSAGNSLGAFIPSGISLRLEGDANDYVGKGLSGGKIYIRPHEKSPFNASEQIIAGNVLLYGATAGEAFFRGKVGERFCVRNSGAIAVAEGIGDHGCEYMTGGRVVVLGETGRNFAAGMSGGIAFVYDPHNLFHPKVNPEMVILEAINSDDSSWLRELLSRYLDETKSDLAERLLNDWNSSTEHFVKVVPVDYKRVLEAAEAAKISGKDETEAVMAASRK
ncbi:MAG TPA: glutamate synthase large subunit [Acidimicrobiales bacterium]|nr:glutamate synthase large subunit [Acidimicrobiales bacterium]